MATKNRFDLLGDDDPSLLAAVARKSERPPPQAAMHAPATVGRSEGNCGGRGYGRGRGGSNPGSGGGGGGYGRGGRGGYSTPGQGAPEDRTQGAPEDRTGGASEIIARASEIIRDAPTRGTWGDLSDIVTKQGTPNAEPEDKKPEHEEMKTFEEHEKALKEKMKALQALKREERKVDSTAFQSMQQLSNKKDNDDIFVKQKGRCIIAQVVVDVVAMQEDMVAVQDGTVAGIQQAAYWPLLLKTLTSSRRWAESDSWDLNHHVAFPLLKITTMLPDIHLWVLCFSSHFTT